MTATLSGHQGPAGPPAFAVTTRLLPPGLVLHTIGHTTPDLDPRPLVLTQLPSIPAWERRDTDEDLQTNQRSRLCFHVLNRGPRESRAAAGRLHRPRARVLSSCVSALIR